MNGVIVALLFFILILEAFHMWLTNKLVDKLMSRNYYDYKVSEATAKQLKEPTIKPEPQFKTIDPFVDQDLGTITGIVG